jgi:hypothetical protein
MGMRKGPWSAEEDHILISYIQTYGHGNWRALPKQAGEHKFTFLSFFFCRLINSPLLKRNGSCQN